ncbi:MAG: hypothetical protein ACREKM_07805 [Longimicrobiales bacterium]
MRLRAIAAVTTVLGAAPVAHAQELPAWRLSAEPTLRIGVATGGASPEQLFRLNSATLLPDGSVLVLNAGTYELRRFDADGTFVGAAGREGEGPGEFEMPKRIYRRRGGNYAVYDVILGRMSIYTPDLTHVRDVRQPVDSMRTFQRDNWITGRYWVDALGAPYARATVDRVLRLIGSPPDPFGYREVLVTRDGFLWVREVAGDGTAAPHWTIRDNNASILGTITLPDGFEPHEIGADYALGRTRDANDVEYFEMYTLERATDGVRAVAAASDDDDPAPLTNFERQHLANLLREMGIQQEIHYSSHGSYAAEPDALGPAHLAGSGIHIAAADRRGWIGLVINDEHDIICAVAIGAMTPIGWPAGRAFCSDPM